MATASPSHPGSLLAGRTALVTGAFSGLGLHFTRVLAAHGARVAMAGRRIELGRGLADEIAAAEARSGDVRAYEMDVTEPASIAAAMARIWGRHPTVDSSSSPRRSRTRMPIRAVRRCAGAASDNRFSLRKVTTQHAAPRTPPVGSDPQFRERTTRTRAASCRTAS